MIQFYCIGFVARELNLPKWLLNHEKLACILQVVTFSRVERSPWDKCVLAAVLYRELTVLCLFLRSTTPAYWVKDHNLLSVRGEKC